MQGLRVRQLVLLSILVEKGGIGVQSDGLQVPEGTLATPNVFCSMFTAPVTLIGVEGSCRKAFQQG